MKPTLFNIDMVRAILDDRKTVTRRVVKPQPFKVQQHKTNPCWYVHSFANGEARVNKPPYQPGDILYVRETWSQVFVRPKRYIYKADSDAGMGEGARLSIRWRPSIHMPKEAARIFLRVTGVRVERLQDITEDQAIAEGCASKGGNMALDEFESLWDSTLKSADRALYSWAANPWVWVIEFERISREEAT